MRETFTALAIERMVSYHIQFFPFLAPYYLTPRERELKANSDILRKVVGDIVDRRKADLAIDSTLKENGNFLTMLLQDPYFMNDKERIIDECITFFIAGS